MVGYRVVLVFLLLAAPQLAAQQADSAANNAYLDESARELVGRARERRQLADLSIERYTALTKERISAGLRALRRDRLLYRREVAGRIEWTRTGPARIEVLGAREAVPIAMKGVHLPGDLRSFMPHLAFDPADTRMLLAWDDDDFVRHPLAYDAEQYYRFASGGTTTIALPDGRSVRLLELRVIPRLADPHLVSGSFWLDAETYGVVQAAFKLARSLELRDIEDEDEDDEDIPRWVRPVNATVDYVAVEYGLYDLQWWLPRLVAFEGVVRVGPVRMPLQYERTYSEYEVSARPAAATITMAELIQRDSLQRAQEEECEERMQVSVNIGGGAAKGDTAETRAQQQCGRWTVVVPTDTAALLASTLLPDDIFATGEQLISKGELRQLGERIERIGGGPALLPEPVIGVSLLSPATLRYNRVEGLSIGPQASVDYGAFALNGTVRLGVADLEPNFELQLQRPTQNATYSLAAYRRLNAVDPFTRPFSPGNSLSALLFGSDEADYYRTLGVELRGEPGGAATRWYAWRLYAQRERSAEQETNFSIRHLLNDAHTFRPNIVADDADAVGAELTLRFNRGLDPEGFRFGIEGYSHGALGTRDFGRGSLTLRLGIPLPGAFTSAIEGAAGTSSSAVPTQHLWYLGGVSTLRGYHASVLSGSTFWRARGEIGYGLPAIRLVAFTDLGWAGAREEFEKSRPLLAVGGGMSMLDGLFRLDLARGLREPKGWKLSFYLDAAL